LANIVYYREASLDLDHRGLTVIRGQNFNVPAGLKKSNGSGKSLLVSTIPNLLYSSSPIIWQNKSRAKKDIHRKGSRIQLDLTIDGDNYELEKGQRGASLKYRIHKNKDNLEPRTTTIAEEMVQQIVPINEEQFWSLVYLDSRRPFVLHMGTVAQRMSFFSDLFVLDDFDQLKGRVQKQIRKLQAEQAVYESRQKDVVELTSRVQDIDITQLRVRHDRYQKELKSLVKGQDHRHKAIADLRLAVSHQTEALDKLSGLTAEYLASIDRPITIFDMTASELLEFRDSLGAKITGLEQKHEAHQEWRHWRRSTKAYRDQLKHITGQKKGLSKPPKDGQQQIEQDRQQRSDLRSKLRETRAQYEKVGRRIKSARRERKQYGEALGRVTGPCKDLGLDLEELGVQGTLQKLSGVLGDLRGQERDFKRSLHLMSQHMEHAEGGQCTVCQQDLSKVQAESIHDTLRKRLSQLRAKRKRRESLVQKLQEVPEVITYDHLKEQQQELRDHYNQLCSQKDKRKDRSREFDKWRAWWDLDNQEQALRVPKRTGEQASDPSKIENELRDLRWMYGQLESLVYVVPKLVALWDQFGTRDVSKLRAKRQHLEQKVDQQKTRLMDLQRRTPRLQVKIEQYEQDTKRLADLEAEGQKLKDRLKDLPVLKMLSDAYSPKGLKSLVVQQLAETVQQNMNVYARHLFHEPTEFEFQIGPNKFDVLFHRVEGSKTVTADVRSLSGAEGRAFNMLLLLGVLPLIPANKRTNILVLDEMTANMDEGGRDLFIQEFLPALNRVIPHIIVVTPTDEEYPQAREFVAQKKGQKMRFIPVM